MTSSGILENLIAGLIGSFLTFLVTWLIRLWKIKHGAFTGRWSQNIYNPAKPEELTKVDLVSVRHNGDTITADIRRTTPEEQKDRSWRFVGRFTNGQIYGHFYSKNLGDPSYGTIPLRQRERGCFQGFYLKGKSKTNGWDQDVTQMQVILLEWKRCSGKSQAETQTSPVS